MPDAMQRLRTVYKNILLLDYDNARTRKNTEIDLSGTASEKKSETDLLGELFEQNNGRKMTEIQKQTAEEIFESLREGKQQ